MKYFIIPQAPYAQVYQKDRSTMGFSAKFLLVMDNILRMESLCESEEIQMIPYIDWQTNNSSLFDETNKGILNEWEYCFENLVDRDTVFTSENYYTSDGEFKGSIGQIKPKVEIELQGRVFRNKNLVLEINRLLNKYVKIKKDISNNLLEVGGNKILAVHCRRSDMYIHPEIFLNYESETYLEKTMRVFKENNFDKIYLATEEIEILNFFREKLGDKVLYQDCYRIGRNESPHQASWSTPPRDNHFTLQTQEVMIDILNMSKCHSLLCGISGVSNLSIYFNGLIYNDVYYFDEVILT